MAKEKTITKKAVFLVAAMCAALLMGCGNRHNVEKMGDNVITAVLKYVKHLNSTRPTEDQIYITRRRDFALQSFDKHVEEVSGSDYKTVVGVRYTFPRDGWSYFVTQEAGDVYIATYCNPEGKSTSIKYRVNFALGVVEASKY